MQEKDKTRILLVFNNLKVVPLYAEFKGINCPALPVSFPSIDYFLSTQLQLPAAQQSVHLLMTAIQTLHLLLTFFLKSGDNSSGLW